MSKDSVERNKLWSIHNTIAAGILALPSISFRILGNQNEVLDPAIGTGLFFSAQFRSL